MGAIAKLNSGVSTRKIRTQEFFSVFYVFRDDKISSLIEEKNNRWKRLGMESIEKSKGAPKAFSLP